MTCSEVAELLLEADPEVLEGSSESALGEHIRSCPRCGANSMRLLTDFRVAQMSYLGVAAKSSPSEIAAHVMRIAGPPLAQAGLRRTLRRAALGLVPLAAAAAALVIVSVRHRSRQEAFQASVDAAFASSTAITRVKVPEGRNAVVFKTRDPGISVVWIY